jgi:hypothetical protein
VAGRGGWQSIHQRLFHEALRSAFHFVFFSDNNRQLIFGPCTLAPNRAHGLGANFRQIAATFGNPYFNHRLFLPSFHKSSFSSFSVAPPFSRDTIALSQEAQIQPTGENILATLLSAALYLTDALNSGRERGGSQGALAC